jgi:hypothetical protein
MLVLDTFCQYHGDSTGKTDDDRENSVDDRQADQLSIRTITARV